MRTRTDNCTHGAPHVRVELDLREAYALGTALVATEGDSQVARRTRAMGGALLMVCATWSLKTVGELAAAAGQADPGTESGRLAGEIAKGLDRALSQAAMDGDSQGRWVPFDGLKASGVQKSEESGA
jgi:hypothetical protein